jgi:hypothetical protein
MECRDLQERLSAYLEGDASPEENRLIEGHLPSCQECRTALEELRKTLELVQGLEEVEPPPYFTEQVMSRVREEKAKGGILRKLFYPLHIKVPIEAFATLLIAVMAIYISQTLKPSVPDLGPQPEVEQPMERDKLSKPPVKPEVKDKAAPAVPAKPPALSKKGNLARVEDERRGQALGEWKQQVEKPREGLLAPEAAKPAPAEPPSQPMLAEKRERVEGRYGYDEPARAAEPLKREDLPQQQYAGQSREKEAAATEETTPGEIQAHKALPASPMLKAAVEKSEARIGFTVRVMDLKTAGEEIEKLLGRLGAQGIERESVQSREVITARLQAEKLPELIEKLTLIGKVAKKDAAVAFPPGDAGIRIEIVSNR